MFKNNSHIKVKRSLYVRPTFWLGFASIFNLFGNYFQYRVSDTGAQADARAMRADWQAIGDDLNLVIDRYQQSIPKVQSTIKKKQAEMA